MKKIKKIKIILGIIYLLVVSSFLYFFLSKFTLEELTSYECIKKNRDYFLGLKQSNFILLSGIFLISSFFWVAIGGFASPLALLSGFIFGKWLGTVFAVIGMTFGATFIYALGNFFFKEIIKNIFLSKFRSLEVKFKKSEFSYLLAYRFIGGVPFLLSNLLPCIFNVKIRNFFTCIRD